MSPHSRIELGLGAPGQDSGPPPPQKAGLPRAWIAILGLVILAALAGGYGLYRLEAGGIRKERIEDLKSIADLKIGQLAQWRRERLGDARVIASSPYNRSMAAQLLASPENARARADLLGRMEMFTGSFGYHDLILAAPDGRRLVSVRPDTPPFDDYTRTLIAQVYASGRTVFGDFNRNPVSKRVHLDVLTPVLGLEGRPLAVMILRTDPDQYLYPLIQSWPTPSRTAETLIVRKEGDQVLFLNRIRHRPDPALTITEPLSTAALPAVQAALGRVGAFEGRDYRGAKVLAYLQAIPETPWFMVAKVDAAEILAEARFQGFVIFGFVVLFIVLAVILAAFVFHYRQRNLYAALYASEQERRAGAEISRVTLYSIGDGVIGTDTEGRVRQMNPVAETLTGWTEAEALGKPITEVFRIVNEETRAEVENPIVRVLREGVIVGLANHTLLIAKDGAERPIADAGAPIRGEQGETSGVVLVFRDQTAERQAEKALAEQRALLEAILDQAVDGIMVCDTQGRLTFINKAASDSNGQVPGDLVDGPNRLEMYHSNGRPFQPREMLLYRALRGETVRGVERHSVTADGRSIWTLSSAAPVKNERGEVIAAVSIHTNINARKRAEAAAGLRLAVLTTLAESATVAKAGPRLVEHLCRYLGWMGGDLWLVDAATQRLKRAGYWHLPDVGLEEASAQADSLAWARGEGFPGGVWAAGEPAWVPDIAAMPDYPRKAAVLKAGMRSLFAFPIRLGADILGVVALGGAETREPDAFIFQAAGEIGSQIGQFIQRKQAEEALRESEQKYSVIFDKSPVAIALTRMPGGVTVGVNDAFLKLFGYTPEEVLGKTSLDLGITDAVSRAQVSAEFTARGSVSGFECIRRTKSGAQRDLSLNLAWVNIGEEKYVLTTIQDITERKRLEDELKRANEELEERVRQRTEEVVSERQRLYGVLDTLPAYVVLLDQDYRVPFANQYFRERFGESQGRRCYDYLFHKDAPCEGCESYKVMATKAPHRWDWTGPDTRDYDVYDFPFFAADGSMLILEMGMDVTERNRAGEQLKRHQEHLEELVRERSAELAEKEARLSSIYASMTEGLVLHEMVYDDSGKAVDYVITEVNPAFEKITGMASSAAVGQKASTLYGAGEPPYLDIYARTAATGESASFETYFPPMEKHFSISVFSPGRGKFATVFQDITERKKAEEALRQSEQRFRALAEALPQIVWTADAEGGVEWFNQRWYDYTGEASPVGEGWSWDKVSHPDDMPRTLKNWQEARDKGALFQNEIRVRRHDGQFRWFLVRAWPILDADKKVIRWFGTNTDIHDMKEAEEALRESEERARAAAEELQVILDAAPVAVWTAHDPECKRITGNVYADNIIMQTARGGNISRSAAPEEAAVSYSVFREGVELRPEGLPAQLAAATGQPVPAFEMELRFPDDRNLFLFAGGQPLFDSQGRVRGSITAGVDVTPLKQAEEELRRHRDELEALVKERTEQLYLSEQRLARESAAVAEIMAEMLSGRLSDEETENLVLGACLEATGSEYSMIGWINDNGKWDVTSYNSQTLNDCAFPEAQAWDLSTGMDIRGVWGWPLLHAEPLVCNDLEQHPDRVGLPEGHVPIESYLGVPVKVEGQVVGMVAVANRPGGYTEAEVGTLSRLVDVMVVSRRYRVLLAEAQATSAELERRVRERTAQLETANREMESFSYTVSHDLRAPLRSMDGFSGALLSKYMEQLDEQGRHYLERIQAASRRMGQLINDLLSLSQVSRHELTLRPVDLSAMARQIALGLQAQDPERLAEFVIAEDMICEGDTRLLQVALENLMGNAWKFTEGRSPARIAVGMARQDGERVYYVRDNGVGFDMTYADKLFGPFQRLHAVHEFPGMGIGLATVQRILSRHGGRIWPEATEGQGATFYFTLWDDPDLPNPENKETDRQS